MHKRWLGMALGCSAWLASMNAQAFCGFYVGGADSKLYNNATQVVLLRDGTKTVLSMQNNYQGPPENFAMVVPVPVVLQKENVKTLPRDVFDRVDQLTAPRLVEYWEQNPCDYPRGRSRHFAEEKLAASPPMAQAAAEPARPLVRIEAQFAVGEYDIVILSADDSLALDTWLRENNYTIPEGAETILRPYVQVGFKFFVAKVDTAKVTFDKGMATLSPLRFHYDDDAFQLPVRLGLLNSRGTQDLIVNIIARNQRYEVANYPNITIPTNIELNEEAMASFGAFYVALFDKTVEETPNAVVTEYAWNAGSCDPCPGPTLQPGDLAILGGDVAAPKQKCAEGDPLCVDSPDTGLQPWHVTITRLHARYTKDSLGEDLVFRSAPPIQGGNGWQTGPDKHGANVVQGGQSMFQGRYIIRHPWKDDITCADPKFGRWGGRPGSVGAARDLAFAPRGNLSLASLLAEDVALLKLKGTAPAKPDLRYNVPLTAYIRPATMAVTLGVGLGLGLAILLLARARRSAS